jgi:hypothetical protein
MSFQDGNTEFRVGNQGFSQFSDSLVVVMSDDNRNLIANETKQKVFDGSIHLVVINKTGNSISDIEYYVDDMTSKAQTATITNQAFNNSNVSLSIDLAHFARNTAGGIEGEIDCITSFTEFNGEPYSKQDRLDLLRRAPGL